MHIPISNINTLMSYSISDGYRREAHVNQQTDVAMSDSVDPYSFYSADGTATANFVMQIGFGEREDTIVFAE